MNELSMEIGEELRAARRVLCLDIAALSAELCITKRQLLALEEGRTEDLPGQTYAIGFLRVYATRLGLDADRMCHAYRLKYGDADTTSQLHFPEPLPEARIPAASVLISGTLALLGIYMGWTALSGGDAVQADLVAAPPARLVALVEGDSGDSSKATEVVVAAAEKTPVAPVADDADDQEETKPVYRLASAQEDTAQPVASQSEAITSESVEEPPQQSRSSIVKTAVASVPAVNTTYEGSRSRIQIHALQDTWVMITDRNERLLMEGVIRSGERYTPPAIPGLRLTTSNAGGLELTLDGRKLAPLGEQGVVIRAVLLDPKRLFAGGAP